MFLILLSVLPRWGHDRRAGRHMKSRKAPRAGGQFGVGGGLFRNLVSKFSPSRAHANAERKTPLAAPLRDYNPQSIGLQSQQYIGFAALLRSPRHNLRHNLPQCVPRLIAPPHYMCVLCGHRCAACASSPQPPRRSPSGEASACRVVLLPVCLPGLRLSASRASRLAQKSPE